MTGLYGIMKMGASNYTVSYFILAVLAGVAISRIPKKEDE
tara:strand:+ start:454 stop:573 length:120 start_codon:yes stop_codon:yes gene_type:complete